jgi:hypothetical protein
MTDYKFVDKVKTKNEVFIEKRKELFDEIIKILNLEINNKESIINKDILETKYEEVNKLLNDILTYFPSSVTNAIQKTENKSLSAIRMILKYYNYKLKYKTINCKKDNKRTSTQIYFITDNIEKSE